MMKLQVFSASFDLNFFFFIFERPIVMEYHKSEPEIIMINVESYNYREVCNSHLSPCQGILTLVWLRQLKH